jgi:enoyl-[acyl-carrier-protein] reductase (NADH)
MDGESHWPGSITKTAQDVTDNGGGGIAVRCDHQNDKEVDAVFKRVELEQEHLHILVNNATSSCDKNPGISGPVID